MLKSSALQELPDGNSWRSLAPGGAPELSALCFREWLTRRLGFTTKEYLRADRRARRRSNSHSPPLRRTPSPPPPHAVAAHQETMSESLAVGRALVVERADFRQSANEEVFPQSVPGKRGQTPMALPRFQD